LLGQREKELIALEAEQKLVEERSTEVQMELHELRNSSKSRFSSLPSVRLQRSRLFTCQSRQAALACSLV